MRHADGLDAKRSQLEGLAWAHRPQVGAVEEPVLAQLLPHQSQRQRRAVHGHRRRPQQVRQGADVILVTMGEDHAAEPLAPLQRVREVGDHVVDAGELIVGKHEAAVDGDEIVAELDEHHVQADLAEAAEGNQADCGLQDDSFRDATSS